MKRMIRASAVPNLTLPKGWWSSYYDQVSLEDKYRDPKGYAADMQRVAEKYGCTFGGELEGKEDVIDELEPYFEVAWFYDRSGNIYIGRVVATDFYPITEDYVRRV